MHKQLFKLSHFTFLRFITLILFCLLVSLPVQSQTDELDVPVAVIAWSPKGDLFAIAGGVDGCGPEDAHKSDVFIFKASSKILVKRLTGNQCRVLDLAWNADGSKIAASGIDALANIWDVQTGELLTRTESGTMGRGEIAWSPDGTQIANILVETSIFELWDAQSGKELKFFGLDAIFAGNNINSLSWHPGGDQIVSGGSLAFDNPDGFVRIWDMTTETVTQEFEHPSGVWGVDWKPDGTQIASGSGNSEIRIWDVERGELVNTLAGDGGKLEWHPFKAVIAGNAGGENSRVTVWDTETGVEIQSLDSEAWVPVFDWSPYGGQLIYTLTDGMKLSGTVPKISSSDFAVVIPEPTLQNLQAIAQRCAEDAADQVQIEDLLNTSAITALTLDGLPDFLDEITELPEGMIPEACQADLLAVGDAVILSTE